MALNLDGCRRFRPGRTLGTTLYAQWGDEASKQDTYLAIFDNQEWAMGVAAALNGNRGEDRRLVAIGRLLYPMTLMNSPESLALDGFVGVATSPEVAVYLSQRVLYQPRYRILDG